MHTVEFDDMASFHHSVLLLVFYISFFSLKMHALIAGSFHALEAIKYLPCKMYLTYETAMGVPIRKIKEKKKKRVFQVARVRRSHGVAGTAKPADELELCRCANLPRIDEAPYRLSKFNISISLRVVPCTYHVSTHFVTSSHLNAVFFLLILLLCTISPCHEQIAGTGGKRCKRKWKK